LSEELLADLKKRMAGSLDALQREFKAVRTGRVSTDILDGVRVEAYGNDHMPLNQLASVSVLDARTLGVQVWDREQVKAVERGISESGLGLNPVVEGTVMRITIPDISEERRKELLKVASKHAENARISIRNIRRDGMEAIKRKEKDKEISEDEQKRFSAQIQKLTDDLIKQTDEAFAAKEKDIMRV
jgi:ribosome recycling factor